MKLRQHKFGPQLNLVVLVLLASALSFSLTACHSHEQPPWPAQNQATFAAINMVDADNTCSVEHPIPATSTGFFALLGAGLLTGLSHCVGMCGPLAGAFTMRRRAEKQEISTPLALFQMGRLTTYFILGSLLGATGRLLTTAIGEWQGMLSIILGLGMALLGLSLLGLLPVQRRLAALPLTRLVTAWLKRSMAADDLTAPFTLGLANGLLPCGPVYAMGLLAAASGDPLKGATIMLIFGLGTLPLMLGFGFSTSLLSLRLRGELYRLAAILVVIVGLQLTLRGLALNGQIAHTAIGSVMLW